jgi:hypothetical protein
MRSAEATIDSAVRPSIHAATAHTCIYLSSVRTVVMMMMIARSLLRNVSNRRVDEDVLIDDGENDNAQSRK